MPVKIQKKKGGEIPSINSERNQIQRDNQKESFSAEPFIERIKQWLQAPPQQVNKKPTIIE
jgi:hypothetical protein